MKNRSGSKGKRTRRGRAGKPSRALWLATTRLRHDPEFTWASGGRPYAELSEGNGQRPNEGTWGLWYSPVRPTRLRRG